MINPVRVVRFASTRASVRREKRNPYVCMIALVSSNATIDCGPIAQRKRRSHALLKSMHAAAAENVEANVGFDRVGE